MTDLEYGLETAKLAIAIFALWAGYHFGLAKAILADWRQSLFRVRNEIWDDMRCRGLLAHPAHLEMRNRINALIRTAPFHNLLFVAATLAVKITPRIESDERISPISFEGDSVEALLSRANRKVHELLIRRVFFETMPGCFFGWPVWIMHRSIRRTKAVVAPLIRGKTTLENYSGNQAKRWTNRIAFRIERRLAIEDYHPESPARI